MSDPRFGTALLCVAVALGVVAWALFGWEVTRDMVIYPLSFYRHRRCTACGRSWAVFAYRRCRRHRVRT